MKRSEFQKVINETMDFVRHSRNPGIYANKHMWEIIEQRLQGSVEIAEDESESLSVKRIRGARGAGLHKHTNYNR